MNIGKSKGHPEIWEHLRHLYSSRPGRVAAIALVLFAITVFILSPGFTSDSRGGSNPASANPEPPLHFDVKRRQVQYGPYTVPARGEDDGMKFSLETDIEKPCTNCLITSMQADLHYANGTLANANTGLWLHHAVLANTAQRDLNCPHLPQRFFASGNERSKVNIWVNGTVEAGYYIAEAASFMLSSELMNMAAVPGEAILTLTYEYMLSPPGSFAHVRPLWLDVGGCKRSYVPAVANSTFDFSSAEWIAETAGRVAFMGGHVHDGGTHLEIKNNGNVMCDCVASYGESPAYIDDPHTHTGMEHISSTTACSNEGEFAAGDSLSITAYYDTETYAPMRNTDGSLEDIMGIALVYFVDEP